MIVSEGLLEACGDTLYPTVGSLLTGITRPHDHTGLPDEDPGYRAAIERSCSAHARTHW